MKTWASFAAGFGICAALFVTLGAGPGNEYDRACSAIDGEYTAYMWLVGDKSQLGLQRIDACKGRIAHWIKVMEQFKP